MENKIKMIITDLDRSLLNNECNISEYTKNVLIKCKNMGFILVFATARPLRETKTFFNSILPHAVICHNGAVVYINEIQFYQCGIKQKMAKNILKNVERDYQIINLAIESEDVIYKKLDIENLKQNNIDKIIIGLEKVKDINDIKNYLPEELYVENSEGKVGLIMNKGATKWNGINKLVEYYKIDIENTIAFGDDYNDIEMVKKCGIGVGMENGIIEIRNEAKYICGNNNEDGIAKWIIGNIL